MRAGQNVTVDGRVGGLRKMFKVGVTKTKVYKDRTSNHQGFKDISSLRPCQDTDLSDSQRSTPENTSTVQPK